MTTELTIEQQIEMVANFVGMKKEAADVWVDAATGQILILGEYRPHKDWNELMPVVEKIESMNSRDVDCRISIEKDTCNIYFDDKNRQYDFNLWSEKSKIKAVWESVVSFIQWYTSSVTPNKEMK